MAIAVVGKHEGVNNKVLIYGFTNMNKSVELIISGSCSCFCWIYIIRVTKLKIKSISNLRLHQWNKQTRNQVYG
jgi:hypothetical protein